MHVIAVNETRGHHEFKGEQGGVYVGLKGRKGKGEMYL